MTQYVPIYFAPDIDNAWSVAPGALAAMRQLCPLQSGIYGTMGTSSLFTLTGSDYSLAKTFRQVNGTVRFLGFRTGNIDEYDSSGTRTNRLTGVTSTAGWDAAAWGNQIIAVDPNVATQSSTGAGFTALGGGSPKARMIASNINFVMMGDVDDGASFVYRDAVWWSGLRNPNTWTPSASTLAGRIRLLDAPGPLTGLVPFRDSFVAFKDNAVFLGTPGGQYTFTWRLISSKVGCSARHSIAECDGRLYWFHTSGFWEFDGQNLQNIGLPVFQSFLTEGSYISGGLGSGTVPAPGASVTAWSIGDVQASADEIEGVICFSFGYELLLNSNQLAYYYLYNVRSKKWGRFFHSMNATGGWARSPLVKTSVADMQAFKSDPYGRLWAIWPGATNATLRSIRYPYATSDSDVAQFSTGIYGDAKDATREGNWFLRHALGTDALTSSDITGTVGRYQNEDRITSQGSVSVTFNPEFNSLQGAAAGKSKYLTATYATAKKVLLGGLALDSSGSGKR